MAMCLNEQTLQALAAGTLPEAELPAAREHLRGCEKCTAALKAAQLALTNAPPTKSLEVPRPRPAKAGAASEQSAVSGPTPAPEAIGPYVLLARIGEGGMGAVYTAYHPKLDRKVAIKLLKPEHAGGETASDLQARLLREAQAMARLSHPNVVAVHDAGEYQNKVYLVMDLVEGVTLKEWLSAKTRSWREVLDVFLQAGRGLAAAHAAGLVHRDFKPSNVLIGNDGRVLVTDFGIARAVGAAPEPMIVPSPDAETQEAGVLSTPITRAGAVMGTPRYMAPEQSLGKAADPRTDQFSFCVALYEALYGEPPFEKPFDPLVVQKVRDPPKSSAAPRFLRQPVLRGLSLNPAERFESMDALLAALESDPARRLRVAFSAVGVGALVVAVVLLGARALRPAPVVGCEDVGKALAGIWDDGARKTVSAALTQAGAKDVDGVAKELDQYAAAWTGLHEATCKQATKARGDDAATLELTCLNRERTDLEALVGVLGHADAEIASHVGVAAHSLVPPGRCSDPRGLALLPRPTSDPKVRAQVEELRLRLASASFEAAAGSSKAASATLGTIVDRARALGQGQLEAEALYALGLAQSWQGDLKTAQATLLEADQTAEAGGADLIAAEAAAGLALLFGQGGHPAESRVWLQRARSQVARV
ncbi:MAG TPA: serine/threonine-protein kinase, partial [Myxococcales bacterium]|nr:serine/threonine-protein kinase [Myxococcales bacterium]